MEKKNKREKKGLKLGRQDTERSSQVVRTQSVYSHSLEQSNDPRRWSAIQAITVMYKKQKKKASTGFEPVPPRCRATMPCVINSFRKYFHVSFSENPASYFDFIPSRLGTNRLQWTIQNKAKPQAAKRRAYPCMGHMRKRRKQRHRWEYNSWSRLCRGFSKSRRDDTVQNYRITFYFWIQDTVMTFERTISWET